jgi:hypothetical protein
MYKVPTDHFKLLKFINLENNGIESWDELDGFRHLENLKRITLNKNYISKITYKPGWNELFMISIEDNLIGDFESFDELNKFHTVKNLRPLGNPVFKEELGGPRAREIAIARVEFVYIFNGTTIEHSERKDHEIYYMNDAYRQFLQVMEDQSKKDGTELVPVTGLEDDRLGQFMLQNHPRWYELVEKHGNPINVIRL